MALNFAFMQFDQAVSQLEASPGDSVPMETARTALLVVLGNMAEEASPHWEMVPDLIERSGKNQANKQIAAAAIIRAMNVRGLLPENSNENHLERRIVDLVKTGAPDLYSRYIGDNKLQTFEQIARLSSIHADVTSRIEILARVPQTPDTLLSVRQDVQKALNAKINVAYLEPFGIKEVATNTNAIFQNIETLRSMTDHTFSDRLASLREFVDTQSHWADIHKTFLITRYYLKFLERTAAALATFDEETKIRFSCSLGAKTQGELVLEKRYPLEAMRIIKVTVPLWNFGPGIALDVSIRFTVMDDLPMVFHNPEFNLGDIPSGHFAVASEIMLGVSRREAKLQLTLEWSSLASTTRESSTVQVKIFAQSSGIDWLSLERRDPYSTAIAEGKDFVGRREKLTALAGRLLKERMQSSYITGQKRIGKSSLALAVKDNIAEGSPEGSRVFFHYLEYGEYAHSDSTHTLSLMGERIAEFLLAHLPEQTNAQTPKFIGTLAPLSRIADQLLKTAPNKRFVVILDEFDEIPSELYRMGPLAETFFANLRTLSGKKNLAFMLVGGENMPFIVSAQGDQLNKFVRESLDYFSRTDEWGDYTQLVTEPVAGTLNWHDSAINKLFTLTNGHPYYTKLLCSRIYSTAVSEKDADITVTEVQRAYDRLVATLDTNAFAHLWKDGIQGTREEVEVIALQRCRLLVVLGRMLRQNMKLTQETIRQNKTSANLPDHQIGPITTDLCRRGILEDRGGEYAFTLPLFRDWTAQSGINKLLADNLGDELAASAQKAEDDAFVKDGEIAELTTRWPAYRGRPITVPDIRAWLDQVPKFRQQRLLFKLLENVRIFSELEIREKLRLAHSLVLKSVPEFVRRSPAERRRDIVVTYVDGAAKSGHYYAARYAEENLLASSCVKEMKGFGETLTKHEDESEASVNGIVIVDDFVGTGKSLRDNLLEFIENHREAITVRNMSIVIVALCAAAEGEETLRKGLNGVQGINVELRICEPLSPSHLAFGKSNRIWDSPDQEAEAKALCLEYGSALIKNAPLGYGGQGLLVVFPQTCPNNSLPILHAWKTGRESWKALFPRPKN